MILSLKVKPNSRDNRLTRQGEILIVKIHAPAQEGKANKELMLFLATALDIPKSRIRIISGHGSAFKRIELPDEFSERAKKWLNSA
jgi:uncharacterized protein (TIGR00251 family)